MGATIDEIIDSLKRGQGKRVSDLVKMALEEGTNPQTILEEGFLSGMEQVAEKFRKEEVGVPEILSVTRALDRGVSTLRHYSVGRAKKEIGTVIIGTVKGDLHDIGKNLVKIMMESKNIRVIDLGVDVSPRRFLEEAVGSHAQIVCLSGIMPHSEEDMRAVVEEFEMKVPFAQAKEIVKKGLAPLGEAYGKVLSDGMENGWIDVYENEGKRSGAYSWGAYGCHPFVLMLSLIHI